MGRGPLGLFEEYSAAILMEGLRQLEKFVGNNRHVFRRNG
jgi:hypothetical protein